MYRPRCRQNNDVRRHCCRHVRYHGIHLALYSSPALATTTTTTIIIATMALPLPSDCNHRRQSAQKYVVRSLAVWLGWMVVLFIRSTERTNDRPSKLSILVYKRQHQQKTTITRTKIDLNKTKILKM